MTLKKKRSGKFGNSQSCAEGWFVVNMMMVVEKDTSKKENVDFIRDVYGSAWFCIDPCFELA